MEQHIHPTLFENPPPKNPFVRHFLLYTAVLVVSGSFFAGFTMGKEQISEPGSEQPGKVVESDKPVPSYVGKDVSFELFWDVWRRVKNEYISKNTADTQLFYGAIGGIVDALDDPYSEFFDPDTAKKFDETLAGSFEGIGAEIGKKKNQLVVIAPLPGTPAELAGLRAADKILFIDKKPTTDMSVEHAVNLIRGKRGTKVNLMIYREGEPKEREVMITREKISVPSVTWNTKEGAIAYIKVASFNQDTEGSFKKAVNEVLSKSPRGLILDLRNNPGGFLDTAVTMAGYWIEGQPVVIERYSDEKREEFKSRGKARLQDLKTVVLVNEGSASASEIVAGALQDYGKATLLGMKTFGKGTVQNFQRLPDGSAVKLTVAEWLTPKGRSIADNGIKPDVEVDLTLDDFNTNKDPQLEKALEMLKK